MTVLVTGGLGYLGSRLLRELPAHPRFSSEEIRILDNFRQPRFHVLWDLPTHANYDFVEADIREEERVRAAMEGVDTVFHLAAITNASATFDIPETTYEVNYDAAVNVYEAARELGIRNFVNVSTCSVYGTTEDRIEEGAKCDPESPYGEAKLAAEREILDRDDGEMNTTSLRLGTVYGWTRGMRFDTVVDKFSLLAASGRPLTVYEGAENQWRPYLHVQDAVRALLFAGSELGDGETYNVVGQNRRLLDVLDAIREHFAEVEVGYTETENVNQTSYVVSDDKIRAEGFETAYSLDRGVKELANKFGTIL